MTPTRLNPATVTARLRLIDEAVSDLVALGEITPERLRRERLTRRVVERCLQVCVDAAAAVNAHVAAAVIGSAPRDLTESFDLAATAGLVPIDLATRLRPSAGMRNAIVHTYVDLDFDLVAAAVPLAIEGYRDYVAAVVAFLRTRSEP